jgi:hypothetical protein
MEWRHADAENAPERDCDRLSGNRPSFKEFLLGEGRSLDGLDLSRDPAPMRAVNLR